MAADKAAKVVFALKTYARYDRIGKKLKVSLTEGIDTVLTLYHNQLKHGIDVIRNYQEPLPMVMCYPDELIQVWSNLIYNSIQAIEEVGTLTIDVVAQEKKIEVSITDTGAGINPEILPHIFEPFFTTKPSGEGSGLGLDIVKKIIKKHSGDIEVISERWTTCFKISLPIE